ncbi:MAG: oxidoreductase domain protein [Firmicutes bacterium]|nr:oxidoreductase domain protein [Bacillota bacterium]
MAEKVRLGLIGCGAIAQEAHLPGFAVCQDVEVVAVCDTDQGRAQEAAERFRVPSVYTNHLELLADKSIHAVDICTPNYLHAPQTIDALRAGKHVLVEKPMATTREDAEAMLTVAGQTGLVLMVGFTHRFNRANRYLKKLVASGVIGEPVSMRVRMAHHGPYDSWSARSDWFFRHEMAGGGAVLDMGIHALDIMRFIVGEITEVKGMTAGKVHNIKDEDLAVVLTRFANGALGSIETGWHSHPGGFGGIEVYCTEGTAVNDFASGLKVWDLRGEMRIVRDDELEGDGGHAFEVRHFVECVKNGTAPEVDGTDGYKAIDLALQVYGR